MEFALADGEPLTRRRDEDQTDEEESSGVVRQVLTAGLRPGAGS